MVRRLTIPSRASIRSFRGKWKWYALGFITPIGLAVIAHVGILFGLPCYVPSLSGVADYLYQPSNGEIPLQIMIGLATIDVVFFSFIQFGYSVRHVPATYVSDYILRDRKSILLISFGLSSVCVAAFFVASGWVFNVSDLLLSALVVVNIIAITWYFFWLVKAIKLENVVGIICGNIDLDLMGTLERNISAERDSMDALLERIRNKVKYEIRFSIGVLFPDAKDLTVRLNETGVVNKIDFKKLTRLLSKTEDHLKAIEFMIVPGQPIQYQGFPFISLVPATYDVAHPTDDHREVAKFVTEQSEPIRKCVNLLKEEYRALSKPMNDILEVYQHVASHSFVDLDRVIDRLSEFLKDARWDHTAGGYSVSSHLLKDFVQGFSAVTGGLTADQISSLVPLIFAMKSKAVERNDLLFLTDILNLMNKILWETINTTQHYNPRIATFVLYYKEIAFSIELSKRIEGETKVQFYRSWTRYYSGLISSLIQSSFEIMYYLVQNFYKRPREEMRLYLLNNADDLVDILMEPRYHWHNIDEAAMQEKEQEYAQHAFHWSLYVFRAYFWFDRVTPDIVTDIAFLLTTFSNRSMIYNVPQAMSLLGQFFFDESVLRSYPFERFEDPDLITAATHLGATVSTDEFWIAYNLWRAQNGWDLLPTLIIGDEQSAYERLTGLLNTLERIDHGKLMRLLNLRESDLVRYIASYEIHIKRLRGDNV